MRKRRRLANKLTIMVCAVLVAVSAFFYAPMEVSAEESENSVGVLSVVDKTVDGSVGDNDYGVRYFHWLSGTLDTIDLSDYLVNESLYKIEYDYSWSIDYDASVLVGFRNIVFSDDGLSYALAAGGTNSKTNISGSGSDVRYIDASLDKTINLRVTATAQSSAEFDLGTVTASFTMSNIVVTEVVNENADEYQNGYDAGYSAGLESGYSNGYSAGYSDGEASVDTDSYYDSGYQAGMDSVDTQSYYDAGYEAGYNVAYSSGYDDGYEIGYESAMERIASWGADTTVYPILLASGSRSQVAFEHLLCEDYCFPFDYHCFSDWYGLDNFNVDANHTYKFEFWFDSISEYDDDWVEYSDLQLFANIGGCKYPLSLFKSGEDNKISIYISGDRMSDSMSFEAVFYGVCNLKADSHVGLIQLVINNLNVAYYDMGPSGDTQNHIANQTDQLTNGFDDSNGNSVNSDFSASLNDYATTEDSLWGTATSNLESFAFFDLSTVPLVVTGISFVTSIMSGWFEQSGGADGVGIVLSILFSVMLVSMALGLYRLYQSQGHRQGKSGSSKGGKK